MTPEEIRITFAAAAVGASIVNRTRDGHAADECWKLADLALRSEERRKIDEGLAARRAIRRYRLREVAFWGSLAVVVLGFVLLGSSLRLFP